MPQLENFLTPIDLSGNVGITSSRLLKFKKIPDNNLSITEDFVIHRTDITGIPPIISLRGDKPAFNPIWRRNP